MDTSQNFTMRVFDQLEMASVPRSAADNAFQIHNAGDASMHLKYNCMQAGGAYQNRKTQDEEAVPM